jgi:hypothetical protein
MFIAMASNIDDSKRCGNTLMAHHFHKKRKKARENSENNMAERLAPGHLRRLSDERVFAHNGRNEEMFSDRHSFFVFCDSVSLSNYFVRLSTTQTDCLS